MNNQQNRANNPPLTFVLFTFMPILLQFITRIRQKCANLIRIESSLPVQSYPSLKPWAQLRHDRNSFRN